MSNLQDYTVKVFLDGSRKPFSSYETQIIGEPTKEKGLRKFCKALQNLRKTEYRKRVTKVTLKKLKEN